MNAIVHINNNTLGPPDTSGSPPLQRAIDIQPGNSSGASVTMCADITGNSLTPAFVSGTWPANKNWGSGSSIAINVQNSNNTGGSFKLPGYSGTATNTAAVASFVAGNNTMNSYTVRAVAAGSGTDFIGGTPCP